VGQSTKDRSAFHAPGFGTLERRGASVLSLTPDSLDVIPGRAPISGLPEIGTCMSKSAKADLEWARGLKPAPRNDGVGTLEIPPLLSGRRTTHSMTISPTMPWSAWVWPPKAGNGLSRRAAICEIVPIWSKSLAEKGFCCEVSCPQAFG